MFRERPIVVVSKTWLILAYVAIVFLVFLLVGETV